MDVDMDMDMDMDRDRDRDLITFSLKRVVNPMTDPFDQVVRAVLLAQECHRNLKLFSLCV